jgi:phosphoribosyl-AMP cyclohydrolase / phosphoribosyl-ATP pyrophosphohydrolase
VKFTPADIERIDWGKNDGLVPAIVQHAGSGSVLMLGYMNRDALSATLERGRVVFYSRSKRRLWEKGESSGNFLQLIELRADCDADALLIVASPAGPVCHTGSASCFGDEPLTAAASLSFLLALEQVIAQRIAEGPEGSYTASLYARGVRRVAQKVGEEGLEVALAGAGESDPALLGECADLLYHLLVLLRSRSLPLEAVIEELRRRHETPQH